MQESRDAYIGHLPIYYDAFPDFELSLDYIFAEGEKVASRWSFTSTHQGDLMGVGATGRQVRASGMTIQRVSDGRIVEGWTIFDTMGLIEQLLVMEQPLG
jgi:predicted ester cyclase